LGSAVGSDVAPATAPRGDPADVGSADAPELPGARDAPEAPDDDARGLAATRADAVGRTAASFGALNGIDDGLPPRTQRSPANATSDATATATMSQPLSRRPPSSMPPP